MSDFDTQIIVEERWNSRRITGGDNPAVEVTYNILGTSDEAAAMSALLAATPLTWGNAPRKAPSLEQTGQVFWEATVVWSFEQASPQQNEEQWSFSTKGGRAKITQSRGTRSYGASGTTPPNFKGAIGVERHGNDSKVEGVEVTIPHLAFSVSKQFAPGWLSSDRVKALADLTGTTNSAPIFGFATGELLFEGAEGTRKNADEPVDVKFDWIASYNDANISGGDITGIAKMGWEYLWFYFEEEEDTSAKALIPRPKAAYVETVYRSADHSSILQG